MFTIEKAGFIALLQDYGRFGLQSQGVTTGGPMDEHAYLWANRLLNNDYNAPQIEITMGAFAGVFSAPTKIALCGADLNATLNGKPIQPWKTYTIAAGDQLEFLQFKQGLRCYLAVAGGFKVLPQLGSVATVVREKLGGLGGHGALLKPNDALEYKDTESSALARQAFVEQKVPDSYIPQYSHELSLRFFPNTSATGVSPEVVEQFCSREYVLSNKMDRMGYRLTGDALTGIPKGIISQGISLGAIQVPADGQPIVLMSDRQTIGGYPQLGCIARVDMAKLSQCIAGAKLRFVASDPIALADDLEVRQRFMHVSN